MTADFWGIMGLLIASFTQIALAIVNNKQAKANGMAVEQVHQVVNSSAEALRSANEKILADRDKTIVAQQHQIDGTPS